jgi:hypothetical protein
MSNPHVDEAIRRDQDPGDAQLHATLAVASELRTGLTALADALAALVDVLKTRGGLLEPVTEEPAEAPAKPARKRPTR